jgi:hypothetical protein
VLRLFVLVKRGRAVGGLKRIATIVATVGVMAGVPISPASAAVTYTATDLPYVVAGHDLWQYTYVVSGPLAAFNAVNLLFAPTLYSELVMTHSSTAVDAVTAEPIPALPADGQLTITALADIPGGTDETIDLDFLWLGVGSPGSQTYEVLADQFNVLDRGETRLAGIQGVLNPHPCLARL